MLAALSLLAGCTEPERLADKGFPVSVPEEGQAGSEALNEIISDSLRFETRPSNVLLTGMAHIRLTTLYKVNLSKDKKTKFIGSNRFHPSYTEWGNAEGNNWNYNFMPGIRAVYGYNMVNVSHYDISQQKQKNFFEAPVLIKTLYLPAASKDTLNGAPVRRDFFMVSVYNEDTNRDGFLNLKDLRRFYWFDAKGDHQKALVPEDYSVLKSEYDPANDLMYVFAQWDENGNGQVDGEEPIHVFWVDLVGGKVGRVY